VLRGSKTIEESIIKSTYDNLDFFPPGQRVRNPGNLLDGENLQRIIANLAEQYDYVIIDAPPLLPVHDTRTLGKAVDISLFVARQKTVSLFISSLVNCANAITRKCSAQLIRRTPALPLYRSTMRPKLVHGTNSMTCEKSVLPT
jgi:MinD-like ATPase involved in chromosome partitioning or flagellar assembly